MSPKRPRTLRSCPSSPKKPQWGREGKAWEWLLWQLCQELSSGEPLGYCAAGDGPPGELPSRAFSLQATFGHPAVLKCSGPQAAGWGDEPFSGGSRSTWGIHSKTMGCWEGGGVVSRLQTGFFLSGSLCCWTTAEKQPDQLLPSQGRGRLGKRPVTALPNRRSF